MKAEQIERNEQNIFTQMCYAFLVLLLVFCPSISFDIFWNPTVSSKFIFFSSILAILIPLKLCDKQLWNKGITINRLDFYTSLLFLYLVFRRAIEKTPVFSIKYYELLGLFALYILLRISINKTQTVTILMAIIVGGFIQIIIGFLQLYNILPNYNPDFPVTGTFFNSGPYNGYLASIFPIALGLYWSRKTGNDLNSIEKNKTSVILNAKEGVLLGFLIGCIFFLPILKSRASLIAMFASCLYTLKTPINSWIKKLHKNLRTTLLASLSIILILGILYLIFWKMDSSMGRFLILKNTFSIISEKPFFGFGFDSFKSTYMDFQAQHFSTPRPSQEMLLADNVYYSFNELLQLIAENGLLSLVFLSLIINTIYKEQNTYWESILSKAGLLSILVFSFFSYSSEILPIKINGIVFLAIISNYSAERPIYEKHPVATNKQAKRIFFTCLALFSSVYILSFLYKYAKGFQLYRNGFIYYSNSDFKNSLFSYSKIYDIFNSDGEYLINLAKTKFFLGSYRSSLCDLNRAENYISNTVLYIAIGDSYLNIKEYDLAENAYENAINMVPNRLYPKYLLLKLYIQNGQAEKADSAANIISNTKLKINSPATDSIRSYANQWLNHNNIQQ